MNDVVQKCGKEAYVIGERSNSLQDYAMVNSAVTNIFSDAIYNVVANLRTEVAHAGAGIAMKIDAGFDAIYQRANGEFQQVLIRTVEYSTKKQSYNNALANLMSRYPDVDEEKIKNPSRNTEQDWVILVAIFLGSLLLEGIIGAFLLGEVLAGGIIAGVGFAIAISLVNILGLGFGMGKVFDYMHRKEAIQGLWFGLWFTLILAINGGIAWYRYDQVSTFNEGGIDPVLAMFLFALLGVVFACFAFWKIYTGWCPESLLHKQWKELDDERRSHHSNVDKIFEGFKDESDKRLQYIGDFYQKLKELLLAADAEWEQLEVNYPAACQFAEREFWRGRNATNTTPEPEDLPPNIDIPKWEDSASKFQSRDEAREFLNKWNSTERKSFVDSHKRMLSDLNTASENTHRQIFRNTGIVDPSSDNNQQA